MSGDVDLFDRTGAPPGPTPSARVVTDGTAIAVSAELLAVAGLSAYPD